MPELRFDRFYRYDELSEILHRWEREHGGLFRLSSLGKSFEERDIWLATVTNFETGPDDEKPAFWLDANIHAREVTGCTAALHLINRLLTAYGNDPKVTRLMDTRAFYVVPRLNPDGAELALADRPRFVRSSVRPYPLTDELDGLHEEDIDGDGRILMMRVRDPNGAWKPHPDDPRLMIPREPEEGAEEGEFYRLLPEGTIRNFDGVMIKVAPNLEGLDLNRNFPMEWATESEQHGAGPYPASEAEVRAMVQGVTDRPNITGHITYHTFSGVHLRPYSGHEDDHFPTFDLRAYRLIGERATAITGYPAISVFHDFRYEPKESIRGGADDWMYDHVGVFSWTTEFWSPQRQAGITDYKFIEWLRDHPVEDDVKLLRWSDERLGGRGYVEWYPFEHRQLGKVELGGWDRMYCWSNPPPEFLEQEIAPHTELAIFHLLISPRLELESVHVESVGADVHHIRVVLVNSGWLPTNVSQKALDRNIVRPLEVEIEIPEGARLVSGEKKVEAGQLTGRVDKRNPNWWGTEDSTTDRAKVEWVVTAPPGTTVNVQARHKRAGTVRHAIELGKG